MACKAFLPALQKVKQGKIINMSSDMASITGECSYCSSVKSVWYSIR
jgi:NADP-dependent 3-hydroxy acid dehydrogenase YdfG